MGSISYYHSLLLLISVCILATEGGLMKTEGADDFKNPFPAFFIFGDSLVDVGNNNYILTLARADLRPFGVDFPQGPTGRFTNGKTVLDVIAEKLGIPFPPPYLAPTTKGAAILSGVNYASAAGGILQRSGFNFLGRVAMDTQLEWFANNIHEMQQLIGVSQTADRIAKSVYGVVIGNNDYINNYFLKISGTAQQYSTTQFTAIVLDKFRAQLTKLYQLGARNVVVGNLGPLGCIPSQEYAQKSVNGECSEVVNKAVRYYNAGLKVLLDQLSVELPGSLFVYVNNYDSVLDFHDNPTKYGFKYGSEGCCGIGKYKGQLTCLPGIRPCANRDEYVFFDAFHPTQRANILLGNQIFNNLRQKYNL